MSKQPIQPSIKLNHTFQHEITNYSFGNLPKEICSDILKDGRPFSHFIERWLDQNYPLTYIPGCKKYDFIDQHHPEIRYDEKTFTKNGCNFCPSNMKGQGRVFEQETFNKKTRQLIFCIVSNREFPHIKVKFLKGEDLLTEYPTGNIPSKDFIKFFN